MRRFDRLTVFPPFTCPLPPGASLIGPPGFTLRFGGRPKVVGIRKITGYRFRVFLPLSTSRLPRIPTCRFPPAARPVRCERVNSPLPRTQFATGTGYYGFFSDYLEDFLYNVFELLIAHWVFI